MTVDAFDRITRVANQLGVTRGYALDALLRSLPDGELERIIGERMVADGEARAAWSRSAR